MGAYVELGAVRAALGEQAPDRDALIETAIAAAEQMIDDITGRSFSLAASASARTYRAAVALSRDGHRVWVDDIGSASGLVVETGTVAGGWTATTDYEAGPANVLALGRPIEWLTRPSGALWPTGVNRVRVTALWGWPSVPASVTKAAALLASRLHRRKDSPEGVVGSADFGLIRVTRSDPDVATLLAPYVKPAVA